MRSLMAPSVAHGGTEGVHIVRHSRARRHGGGGSMGHGGPASLCSGSCFGRHRSPSARPLDSPGPQRRQRVPQTSGIARGAGAEKHAAARQGPCGRQRRGSEQRTPGAAGGRRKGGGFQPQPSAQAQEPTAAGGSDRRGTWGRHEGAPGAPPAGRCRRCPVTVSSGPGWGRARGQATASGAHARQCSWLCLQEVPELTGKVIKLPRPGTASPRVPIGGLSRGRRAGGEGPTRLGPRAAARHHGDQPSSSPSVVDPALKANGV